MMTLDEAFRWYKATQSQLNLFGRLGKTHWGKFPDESPLWRDEKFKQLESGDIVDQPRIGLVHLNDVAVMVLFSAFEAIFRDRVLSRAQDEREQVESALLAGIIDASLHDLRKKAISHVLKVFKGMDSGLVEEVNQVRRYRNWVAHGRPDGRRPDAVAPEVAPQRLRRFLETLPEP